MAAANILAQDIEVPVEAAVVHHTEAVATLEADPVHTLDLVIPESEIEISIDLILVAQCHPEGGTWETGTIHALLVA